MGGGEGLDDRQTKAVAVVVGAPGVQALERCAVTGVVILPMAGRASVLNMCATTRKGLGQLQSNPLPVFPAPTRVNIAVASRLDKVRGLRSRQGDARCAVLQGENLGLRERAALSVLSMFESDNQGRHRDNHDVWIMVSGHLMSMAGMGRMRPVMSLESGALDALRCHRCCAASAS